MEDYPASWLEFLAISELDHPSIWMSRPQSPDYLPAEFTATPAYSSVYDISRLISGFPGTSSVRFHIDSETKLISIQALNPNVHFNLNIDFRRHPILGIYGVAQVSRNYMFPIQSINFTRFYYAGGIIPLFLPKIMELESSDVKEVTDIILRSASNPSSSRENSRENPHRQALPPHLGQNWLRFFPRFRFVCLQIIIQWSRLIPSSPTARGGLQLLLARGVETATVFPWGEQCVTRKVVSLLAFSGFWPTAGPSDDRTSAEARRFEMMTGYPPNNHLVELSRRFLENKMEPLQLLSQRSDILMETRKIDHWIQSRVTLEHLCHRIASLFIASGFCHAVLQKNKQFSKMEVPEGNLGFLQNSSDYIALFRDLFRSEEVNAVLTELVYTGTNGLFPRDRFPWEHNIEDEVRQGMIADLKEEFSKLRGFWEPNETTPEDATRRVNDPLDELLIYRAVLTAMCLSSSVDNSFIMENPDYRKQIPIL